MKTQISPQQEKEIIAELYKKFGIDPEKQRKETAEFMKNYYNEPWKIKLSETLKEIEEIMCEHGMGFEEVAAETILRGLIEKAIQKGIDKLMYNLNLHYASEMPKTFTEFRDMAFKVCNEIFPSKNG